MRPTRKEETGILWKRSADDGAVFLRIHANVRVGGDVVDHRIGHVGEHLAGNLLLGQHIVAARAAEAIAVDADGDRLILAQLAAVKDDGGHALADGVARVDGVMDAGEEIVIVMLHLRAEEFVRDAEVSVFVVVKIRGGALDILLERGARHLQHDEGVGVDVGGNHVADGDLGGQPLELVGQGAGGNLRAGGFELDGVDEVGEIASVQRGFQVILGDERQVEMTGGRIQPRLHALFQREQQVAGARQRLAISPFAMTLSF